MKRILSLILSASLALLSAEALAVKIGPADVPGTAKVAGKDLKLNGGGERKQMGVITMYVAGLYLEKPATTAADALNSGGAKRLTLIIQKPLPSAMLSNLFYDAVSKNTPASEQATLKDRLEKMKVLLSTQIPTTAPGDVINFDAIPGKGLAITYSGKSGVIETIPGDDFVRAVLRIWLGDKPAEESLKQSLLKGGM